MQGVISTITRMHIVCIHKHTHTQSMSMDWNDAGSLFLYGIEFQANETFKPSRAVLSHILKTKWCFNTCLVSSKMLGIDEFTFDVNSTNSSQKICQSYNIRAVATELLKHKGGNTCMEFQDIIKNFTHT